MNVIDKKDSEINHNIDFSSKDLEQLSISFVLSQKVPYKKYNSFVNSKLHQTKYYNTAKMFKPICLI